MEELVAQVDLARVSLADVLYALGDPVRLRIVRIASAGGELPCTAFDLGLPKATASRHF